MKASMDYSPSSRFNFSIDGSSPIKSKSSLRATYGAVNGSSTISQTFSLAKAKRIASKKCFSILLKWFPDSPICSALENTGRKNSSPFCKMSGTNRISCSGAKVSPSFAFFRKFSFALLIFMLLGDPNKTIPETTQNRNVMQLGWGIIKLLNKHPQYIAVF